MQKKEILAELRLNRIMSTINHFHLETLKGFFGVKFPYGMKETFMKEMESSLQTEIINLSDANKIRRKITQFLALKRLSNGSITRIREMVYDDIATPKV